MERFATDRFRHEQSLWYYVPVVLLSLTPWAVLAVAAMTSAIRESIAEWKARRAKGHYRGFQRAGDAFPEFLVIWALLPILFFTSSDSKLPGYILPSIPPITILVGDYINRRRTSGLSPYLLWGHAVLVGLLTAAVLLAPSYLVRDGLHPGVRVALAATMAALGATLLILVTVGRFGIERLRAATLIPLVVLLLFVFGIGPFFGIPALKASKRTIDLLNLTYSPRPVAELLAKISPRPGSVAVFRVRRDVEYGLSFYRDQRVLDYDRGQIPDGEHVLITRQQFADDLPRVLAGRRYVQLYTFPEQDLLVYRVYAKQS